jgi:hypothetical protein
LAIELRRMGDNRSATGVTISTAGAPFSERSLRKSVYYYPSHSSRAAMILCHLKQTAEAMWGGLAKPAADCQNRPAATTRKAPGANGCRLRPAALRGRLVTAPKSACREQPVISQVDGCGFALGATRGRLATGWQPAAGWQPEAMARAIPSCCQRSAFGSAGHGRATT